MELVGADVSLHFNHLYARFAQASVGELACGLGSGDGGLDGSDEDDRGRFNNSWRQV